MALMYSDWGDYHNHACADGSEAADCESFSDSGSDCSDGDDSEIGSVSCLYAQLACVTGLVLWAFPYNLC